MGIGLGLWEMILIAIPVVGGIFFMIYWLMSSGKGDE